MLALLTVMPAAGVQPPRHVAMVEPRIDTVHSRWIFFSSASRPFGMVSLMPDTQPRDDWKSGYIYTEKYIRCFSHIHCWQIAGVPVMPAVGAMRGHEGFEGYKTAFSHDNEAVKPGYHKVVLENGITVELTATRRVGLHRYGFPAAEEAYVYFDTGAALSFGGDPMRDAATRRVNDRELAGYAVMPPTARRPKPFTVYFVAQFDRPMTEFGGWERGPDKQKTVRRPAERLAGPESGGFARFRFVKPGPLLLKVATSYVSEAKARLNLKAEAPGWDFDAAVRDAYDEWERWLGAIDVEGGSAQQRTKFYTDLWHALVGRHAVTDVDGEYVDNTGEAPRTRRVPLDAQGKPVRDTYNSDAFWGTQWNLNILWSMAYPRLMRDMVENLLDYYRNGGMIARGPCGGNYSFVMVGDPATPLIAAAYHKGIRDFDIATAYAGCRKNAFPGGIRDRAGYEQGPDPQGGGTPYYVDRGYIPEGLPGRGGHKDGAGMTMEYAYEDWCLAQFAKSLGKNDDYELFRRRSQNWRNLFDAGTGWIRPRRMDGSWQPDFKPAITPNKARGFVEANSAIYTYFVPQDVAGLATLMGGQEKFIQRLNRQFEDAAPYKFTMRADGDTWMDYTNQPSCHMAHLFSHAGAPWLTQYWVRRVKDELFGEASPYGGYNGDEDQGQMGGVSALMAIGLFDIQGGAGAEPRYEITSPLFERIQIRLDPRYYPGKTFTIVTANNKPGNVYIQSAKLNGAPIEGRFWITHREFAAGGTLRIELGPAPNKNWR